jgi:hypothetical protein
MCQLKKKNKKKQKKKKKKKKEELRLQHQTFEEFFLSCGKWGTFLF